MELAPCIECGHRAGHSILGGSCTRCARDNRLFVLRCIADELEKAWSDYCDAIYHVEVFEGERVPPSKDRADGHDVQGEPAMGLSSTQGDNKRRFSTPMKQPSARSYQDDEEMTDDDEQT